MAPDDHRVPQGGGSVVVTVALCLLALCACAGLPPLKPPVPGADLDAAAPFPQGRWQLVHRIEARFPGDHKALMMGALELDSATGHLTCALMTVEGFTLFSASKTDRLRVERAVPPFDGPGFAEGLLADLGLIFFAPPGARLAVGAVDNRPVRRYLHPDGSTTDVVAVAVADAGDRFRIDRYTADAKRFRRAELTLQPATQDHHGGIAAEILLEASGKAAYTLRLDLIDAIPLCGSPGSPHDNFSNGKDPKDSP